MAMTDNQKLFAMYAIGQVESNWNWQAVNYNDPITIGMMQWYGTRAAGLLNRLKTEDPTAYALLAQSLQNSVNSIDQSNGWWNSRYLTRSEGNSWASAAARPDVHKIQQNQFIQGDIPAYINVLTSWGLTEDNVKTMIFAMSMYHQGPRYAGQVIATVGNTDLDTMWRTCLNHSVLGQYANRYDTVHATLAAWDGVSGPPDFGQEGGSSSTPGGDAGAGGAGIVTQKSGISTIRLTGDQLIVYSKDFPDGLVCTHNVGDEWIPTQNSAKVPQSGGSGTTTPPTDGGASGEEVARMQQLWFDNANKWEYGQGAGRLNPPQSGYSDCSGCIWWAINSIDPDKAKNIGTWTGAMANNGVEIARGTDCATLPLNNMMRGDIILLEWGYQNYAFNDGSSHVEWYTGNGQTWGAGSGPLPHASGAATNIGHNGWPALGCYMVRRIL